MSSNIVTRIAPSPTGRLHLGTARSALFNYLFARHHGGTFIVRVEDTDKERSTKEFEKDILDNLAWLGLKEDALYRQSERENVYVPYIQQLLDKDAAYISEEESKQEPGKRVSVVRLRNPGTIVTFSDEVRGEIAFDTTELGDLVIARSTTEPLYHLAVVIDDYEMNVTHVIRGEDHISNTPRQILIQGALGLPRPSYAHLPLILASDRSKLSKRHGAISVSEYAKDYLPEAIVNYLALLGWNPGTNQEFFSLEELVKVFDLAHVQKGGAVFDLQKLGSMNHHYITKMNPEAFKERVRERLGREIDDRTLTTLSRILQEKIRALSDIDRMRTDGELDFFFSAPVCDPAFIPWKDDASDITKEHLKTIIADLTGIPETDFFTEKIKASVWGYASKEGRGSVLWPMRYALTGRSESPDPFSVAEALGKDETIRRLKAAHTQLEGHNASSE